MWCIYACPCQWCYLTPYCWYVYNKNMRYSIFLLVSELTWKDIILSNMIEFISIFCRSNLSYDLLIVIYKHQYQFWIFWQLMLNNRFSLEQDSQWLLVNCGWFYHDDVIKWKHFPRYWPFVRGIHRSPVNSPHKRQWRGAVMFSLICVWINGWVNNREAGDLRRYRAHYDISVMIKDLASNPYIKCH